MTKGLLKGMFKKIYYLFTGKQYLNENKIYSKGSLEDYVNNIFNNSLFTIERFKKRINGFYLELKYNFEGNVPSRESSSSLEKSMKSISYYHPVERKYNISNYQNV